MTSAVGQWETAISTRSWFNLHRCCGSPCFKPQHCLKMPRIREIRSPKAVPGNNESVPRNNPRTLIAEPSSKCGPTLAQAVPTSIAAYVPFTKSRKCNFRKFRKPLFLREMRSVAGPPIDIRKKMSTNRKSWLHVVTPRWFQRSHPFPQDSSDENARFRADLEAPL